MSAQPIDRRIARQAARWFVRLQGNASPRDREACDHWRASHADHERAWQLAAGFHARFDAIPADIGMPALGRPASLDRRHTLKLLTSLIIAAPLGTLAYQALPWREWSADQRTVAGERRECVLPDGTRVMLNTASAMDIRFDSQQRLLRCDPAVADWQISGTFQLHDTDLALAALARTLPVDIRTRSRYWVTIAARES